MHQTALITRHPQLSMPLGVPALVEAQIAGLARAAIAAGQPDRVHFTVRHLSDAREAAALREIGDRVAGRTGTAVPLGGYLTSPRGVASYEQVARASQVAWIEVRVLQAAVFGLPPRLLLSQQPLDEYLRLGMLSADPRVAIDPSVDQLLAAVAALARDIPSCQVGLRLTGTVAEPLLARLHELGFRRFAVESHEARPASLALGQAAMAGAPG
jgi:pyruvate,orthophosphate dikinase